MDAQPITRTLETAEKAADPKALFKAPDLAVLCAAKTEGQFFERKSKRDPERLAETICAFANSNDPQGGLLAVGISDDGRIEGLRNRADLDENKLVQYHYYTGTPTQSKYVDCTNQHGQRDHVLLIFVPYLQHRVAETSKGKAFVRRGDQSVELRDTERRELEYAKGQVSFEDEVACPFEESILLADVVEEYRKNCAVIDGVPTNFPLDQLLQSRHLVVKRGGELFLTKAAVLLLGKDPRAYLPGAYVRFVRYSGTEKQTGAAHNATKDQIFGDPLPRLMIRIADFLRSQFREFTYLGPDTRFVHEPEYPEFAWQEALVNSLVHRSYSLTNTPVLIEMFDDRLEVTSPGDYPPGVTPREFIHNPRNPRLMDGMRSLRFVRMLSEGSLRMRQEMQRVNLPMPDFSQPGGTFVRVTLRNDLERRMARQTGEARAVREFGNLFRITWTADEGTEDEPPRNKEIADAFAAGLRAQGFGIDTLTEERAVERTSTAVPELAGSKYVSIHSGFSFHLMTFSDGCYIALGHDIQVKNRATLAQILAVAPYMRARSFGKGFVRHGGQWEPCRILEVRPDGSARIELLKEEQELDTPSTDVLPNLKTTWVAELLGSTGSRVDLFKIVKRLSLNLTKDAARQRAKKTEEIAEKLASSVFPLRVRTYRLQLDPHPQGLNTPALRLRSDLKDVQPVFNKTSEHTASTILNGLSTYGSYEKPERELPLVLLCTSDTEARMRSLVDILRTGRAKFRGVEKTFSIGFGKVTPAIAKSPEDYVTKCRDICPGLPEKAFFLVYSPDAPYSRADYEAPYYQVKRFLLEAGFASQMVDEDTLADPSWKDYNLALDIFAKAGHVPWVLSEGLPNADLFLGLSYSSIQRAGGITRFIGYVNVFDRYGKWLYYQGNTRPIRFEERDRNFGDLLRRVANDYGRHAKLQRLHVHHGFGLSREARQEIAGGVCASAPEAEISFVHVNEYCRVRLYDANPAGDGSVRRGTYVLTDPNRFFIATTGRNDFGQKGVGTPRPLEVRVNRTRSKDPLDARLYAQHMLSLTRLNWASTKDFCRAPITLKFAGDIAYLMNVFLSSHGSFTLHPRLERTPWFL